MTKPLRVALIVKNRPAAFLRDNRAMGWWSYAVPEFTWEHFALGKNFIANTHSYADRFDLIFHEDGGSWGTYIGDALPIVYLAIDSTLSEENHYKPRYEQARNADLILVDHDRLERFTGHGKPVKRLSYCVNDRVFMDYGLPKTADFVFHCNSGAAMPDDTRSRIRVLLHEYAQKQHYRYRSGALSLEDYAKSMNGAKVVVNQPRTPRNRPHRVFDAMACRSALLTGELPQVSDEFRSWGRDHFRFFDDDHLLDVLGFMLKEDAWKVVADAGYDLIQQHHTWAVRAKELRELLYHTLKI